jgi:hypothetical protein
MTALEGRTHYDVAEHSGTRCRTLHTLYSLECHPWPSVLSLSPAAGSKTHLYKIIVWTEAFASLFIESVWCGFDRASSILCGNKMPTRCNRWIFIADLIVCPTCFGHLYAHHQEL